MESKPRTSSNVVNQNGSQPRLLTGKKSLEGLKSEKSSDNQGCKNDVKPKCQPARVAKWQKRMRHQPGNVTFQDVKGTRHEYYKEMVNPEAKDEVETPRAICVADRVEASAKEMRAMLKAVSQHTNNKTILQWLPRHMRRRAASHNRKRLPRRLHNVAAEMAEQAQASNGSTGGGSAKPVNRKKRRRKRDLQNEYAKRAGKQGWLETHLWHAKRFHMTDSDDPKYKDWGHRVALFPNDKSFRACHRAVAKHCLIQDISYMRCINLSGSTKNLCNLLEAVTDVSNMDELTLSGEREIQCLIYKRSATPEHSPECIGPAWVLWRPSDDCETRCLLMWIHPVIQTAALQEVETARASLKIDVEIRDMSDQLLRFRLTGPKSSVTLMSVFRPLDEYPACGEEDEGSAFCKWMKDRNISGLHHDFLNVMEDCHRRIFAKPGSYVKSDRVPEYFDGSVFPVITDDPRLTLPLNKDTPSLTSTRSKYPITEDNGIEHSDAAKSCDSPLWEDLIRDEVKQSKIPDNVASTRKREQKFAMNEDQQQQWRSSLSTAVPVIVVRKIPNAEKQLCSATDVLPSKAAQANAGPLDDFASGWDVILPSGWGTAFWIPFVYNRARVGGLRESRNISLECLVPHFPDDFPDTEAGKASSTADSDKVSNKYYRKPPAKRPNYAVLGVQNPFQPDWDALFENAATGKSETFEFKGAKRAAVEPLESGLDTKKRKIDGGEVILDQASSGEPKEAPEEAKTDKLHLVGAGDANMEEGIVQTASPLKIMVLRDIKKLQTIQHRIDEALNDACGNADLDVNDLTAFPASEGCLVCVSLQSLSKGVPFSPAMLCLPTVADLNQLCKEITDPYLYGLQSVAGPEEPKHWDPYRKERKEARKEAKKRKKKKKEEASLISEPGTQNIDPKPQKPPPNNPKTFPVPPSREVMGYITSGDFVFSHACGAGLGFVSADKLFRLVRKQATHEELRKVLSSDGVQKAISGAGRIPILGLVRNTDTVQYRFVKIELVKPS